MPLSLAEVVDIEHLWKNQGCDIPTTHTGAGKSEQFISQTIEKEKDSVSTDISSSLLSIRVIVGTLDFKISDLLSRILCCISAVDFIILKFLLCFPEVLRTLSH